jgi:FdhD protein
MARDGCESTHHQYIECPTLKYEAIEVVGDTASNVTPDVCVEESVSIVLNGSRIATLTVTPDDLEAFAIGYLKCEGLVKKPGDIERLEVKWPDIEVDVPSIGEDGASLWMEVRSSGCVGVKASWEDIEEPAPAGPVINKATIFYCMDFVNQLAKTWRKTGGTHCTIIFDEVGGLVSYAEDIGRHNSVDKAVGKALLGGRDLSGCFMACTGRMAAGMVAKAYRAGVPVLVSNTAPFTAGIELAKKTGITLVCFARPPRMLVYTGAARIGGIDIT